jgi:hypothetical protein
MLLVDDILLFPIRGVLWCFREIHRAAQEDLEAEGEAIRQQLIQLYMQLETGRISEAEFDEEEKRLLDGLDKTQESGSRVLSE